MKAKKTYAVFGLGRYGTAVARELVDNGMEVIAVDTEQRIVNDAAARILPTRGFSMFTMMLYI